MLNEEEFLKGMALLMAAYPDYTCSPKTVDVYRQSLQDFNSRDFEKVVLAHINQHKWFPKICELREELVRLRGFNRPTAIDEWDRLIRAAEADREPEMDENTERALRVCGGWDGFCRMTYKDLQFHRRDFERVFNEGREREDRVLRIGHDGQEQKRLEVLK